MSYFRSWKEKNPLLTGAFILTLAGMISRIAGFFYRVFLSREIGAEGMGIYQLVFPVYGICFSLCCGPIQTAISRYVAANSGNGEAQGCEERGILSAGMVLSLALSLGTASVVFFFSDWIALHLLGESRCSILLKMVSLCIPVCGLHCCISGYYYGKHKAAVPAGAQLTEQFIRISSVALLCNLISKDGGKPDTRTALVGLILGEFASLIFSSSYYLSHRQKLSCKDLHRKTSPIQHAMGPLVAMALPLAANRLCLSLLQSTESILIPVKLQAYGITSTQALSIYGVLTGMAYPFILFPSAIVNSVAVVLLPDMASAQAEGDQHRIDSSATRVTSYCLYLGILCTGLFLFYGKEMGEVLYSSSLAGNYITTLSWLCPFLYLSTTQGSILNGLGNTSRVFLHNMISLGIQLAFVVFAVPLLGIGGYLYGLLIGQLILSLFHGLTLRNLVHIAYEPFHNLFRPLSFLGFSLFLTTKITVKILFTVIHHPLLQLCLSCALLSFFYCSFLFLTRKKP